MMARAADDDVVESFKFPRTAHVLDAGGSGVSRDDLLLSAADAAGFYAAPLVSVEEKVDGACLALMCTRDLRIVGKNRAHVVNAASARQWSTLDAWIDGHRGALFDVLAPGGVPSRVLCGEWLYAKHSILYSRLPGVFCAFDLYDARARRFYSRARRDAALEGSGLPTVPLIAERRLCGAEDVLALLETESRFTDGKVRVCVCVCACWLLAWLPRVDPAQPGRGPAGAISMGGIRETCKGARVASASHPAIPARCSGGNPAG